MTRSLYLLITVVVIITGHAAPSAAQGRETAPVQNPTAVIEGRLVDPDGLPVPDVSVQLEGEGLSHALEAVSSADGLVRFEAVPRPGAYIARTPAAGAYLPTATPVEVGRQQMTVTIEVKLTLGFAEEVRVTASAIDDRFADRDELGSVTTITGKAIEDQHVRNVVQVLQAVPGVTPDLYGGSDTVKIKFRGVENQRFYGEKPGVAIIVDGVPVFERTGRVNLDLDNIDSLRVVKGGASYLFGDDALSGAIIITTKRGVGNRGVKLDYDAGSFGYNRKLARVGFGNSWGTGYMQVVGRGSDDYYFQSAYGNTAVTGSARFFPTASSDITVGFERTDRKRDKHGAVTGVTQAAEDPRAVEGRDYTRNYDVLLDRLNVTYANAYTRTTNLLLLGYQYRDHTQFWSAPQRYTATGAAVTSPDAYQQLNDYRQVQRGGKSELRTAAGPFGLMAGGEFKRNTYDSYDTALTSYRASLFSPAVPQGALLNDDYTIETTTAAYGELKWAASPRWTLTANGRYDHIALDYTAAPVAANGARSIAETKAFDVGSWRAGTTFTLARGVAIYGGVSTGFRAPSVEQLYRGSLSVVATVANNPDLSPEHTRNVDLGLRAQFRALGLPTALEITGFVLDRRDFILDSNGQYAPTNPTVIARYENIGGARHRGVEVALKTGAQELWSLEVAYSFLDAYFTDYDRAFHAVGNQFGAFVPSLAALRNPNAQYTAVAHDNTGNKIPRVPSHLVNARLNWIPVTGLRVTSEIDGRSKSFADEINQVVWPSRTVLNLQASFATPRGRVPGLPRAVVSPFIRVDNVFATRHWLTARGANDSASYGTNLRYDGVYDAEDVSLIVAPGRTWNVGLSVKF
ncbi:MAG TPA: TonB-dependent receptor [Vicinamibacterales bacterium]|nr:TonB-dependent receptor [Vicinamibacterales bacterium]